MLIKLIIRYIYRIEFYLPSRCPIFKHVSRLYHKLFSHKILASNTTHQDGCQPKGQQDLGYITIPRNQHTISRADISENALKVLYRLNKQGYDAYLVGGSIRDLLLGNRPKDFDITTNATPEQVQKIFRNCRLVGRRFRLAHIIFGKEIIEVATFRGTHDAAQAESNHPHYNNNGNSGTSTSNISRQSQSGMLLRDNVYGTIEQDAIRRDFTLNALYYDINSFTIRDYCHGLQDLQNGVVRLIGDPETRYREDPVRMLRAVRFAAKLGMQIDPQTAAPIKRLAPLLKNIPAARLFDESLKLLQTGHGYATYQLLREYHLFEQLFPTISHLFNQSNRQTANRQSFKKLPVNKQHASKNESNRDTAHNPTEINVNYIEQTNLEKIVELVLKNTDTRIANGKRINPAFMFTAFFWYPILEQAQVNAMEGGLQFNDAFSMAISDLLADQCKVTAIPRRLTTVMGDIWRLQLRMAKRNGKRVFAILEHPKFRAAYDLLELRANVEKGELLALAKWWDEFQYSSAETRMVMIKQLPKSNRSKIRR